MSGYPKGGGEFIRRRHSYDGERIEVQLVRVGGGGWSERRIDVFACRDLDPIAGHSVHQRYRLVRWSPCSGAHEGKWDVEFGSKWCPTPCSLLLVLLDAWSRAPGRWRRVRSKDLSENLRRAVVVAWALGGWAPVREILDGAFPAASGAVGSDRTPGR